MREGGGQIVVTGGSQARGAATPAAKTKLFSPFRENVKADIPPIFSLTKEESSVTFRSAFNAAKSYKTGKLVQPDELI
jgi:hypothetical protein